MSARRIAIVQSNYIPWKGYFDLIASVDEFVLFDDVQYTRRDWRNRNKIKTKDGLVWLTIAVEVKGKYFQAIDETRIADPRWIDSHLGALRGAYARAPFFKEEWAWVEPLYRSLEGAELLSAVNRTLIEGICTRLGIGTPIRASRDVPHGDGKNDRLIDICRALGASAYLSGPAARDYIDEALWRERGIEVEYKSYDGYREYPQLYGAFEHGVSILDVLFNTGPQAAAYIRAKDRPQ
ncbi:MAG: WbqC family protein [Candidatus Eremiobacteraeota bacterium]|nr:WbqC family protein [Candidatus Eremiobacteraeota bacterium]